MPVALGIDFVILAMGFFLFAFIYANRLILVGLIRGILGRVPFIGGVLADTAERVVNNTLSPILSWLQDHIGVPIRWLDAMVNVMLDLPHEVRNLAVDTKNAIAYLVDTKVMQLIHSVTAPIARAVNHADTRIGELSHTIDANLKRVERDLTVGIDRLHNTLTRDFTRGIDRLRHDVFSHAIPGLEHEIANDVHSLEHGINTVARDVAHAERQLAELAKRLDIPVRVIEQLIAAVGVATAVQALETLASCHGKLRNICTVDPADWATFIAGLATLLAWPGLREMALMGASVMEDVSGVVKDLAES